MHAGRSRRALVVAVAAALVEVGQQVAPLSGIAQSNQQASVGARLMRGAVDLHYHVDPGYGVYENLAQAKAAGVRALLLKNHYEPTAALVMLLRPQFVGLELYAGFVFNRSNGGVNVPGVEYMASIRGEPKPAKIVWLPAGDTEKEAKGGRNPNVDAPFVAVSKDGQLVPEIKRALAVIAKNNLTLASGHVVPEDALLAFREARAAGVQRLIATHAADLTGKMTLEQMKEAATLGAWIEFDYRNTLEGNRTDLIRGVGPEHCFLSEFWTGNGGNGSPKEYAGAAGVGAFAAEMKRRGFTDRELEMMFKDNPARAIGLPVQAAPAVAAERSRTQAPEQTAANQSGDAADVLALQEKIEQATVKGDVAFAETVLSTDFHFRHGDGWTRGEKTGGIEDDRAAFMRRIADKEYLVHDLDNPQIEMHGNVAITHGRYVSLFVPKNGNGSNPPGLATIWFERVWAKRDGRWQWLSHRTVWGPHPSPAGVDPTQIPYELPAHYVPGLPPANAAPETYQPQSKEAAELLEIETKLGASVPAGDQAFFESHTSPDFLMWHSDPWTRGSRSSLIDTKQAFANRVRNRQYLAWHYDSQQAEMHGDVAVTFGRYTATLRGSKPDTAWFSVWYERVYQRQNQVWMLLSQRTVHGATYGPTRESISDK